MSHIAPHPSLSALYARIQGLERGWLSRSMAALDREAAALEHSALASGAMPNEFHIVYMFRPHCSYGGRRLQPVLR